AEEDSILTAIRRAGAWFGWSPGDVMALPYADFVSMMLEESEERRRRYGNGGR
ncbi:hypothetical protein AT456_004780, partial [Escherichia coli]